MTKEESRDQGQIGTPRKAAIFLNGTYAEEHLQFYRDIISQRKDGLFIIAVDGALNFFAKAGMNPDLIVGDFDSASPEALDRFGEVETQTFPREKDATDGELAIRYALDAGYDELELYGGIDTQFETDQLLSNLFMLILVTQHARKIGRIITARMTDHLQHIYLVSDSRLELKGKVGDKLSIIPLANEITASVHGVKWELEEAALALGSTYSSRNEFSSDKATIEIRGLAIVVHRHSE